MPRRMNTHGLFLSSSPVAPVVDSSCSDTALLVRTNRWVHIVGVRVCAQALLGARHRIAPRGYPRSVALPNRKGRAGPSRRSLQLTNIVHRRTYVIAPSEATDRIDQCTFRQFDCIRLSHESLSAVYPLIGWFFPDQAVSPRSAGHFKSAASLQKLCLLSQFHPKPVTSLEAEVLVGTVAE